MAKYEVNPAVAANNPISLVTLNEQRKPVNLYGVEVVVDVAGDAQKPPTKRTVKGATQADLEYLFNSGNPLIIKTAAPDIAKAEK